MTAEPESRSTPLSDRELGLLNGIFSRELGLFFRAEKSEYLAWRLQPRLDAHRLGSFAEYYQLLRRAGNEELLQVVPAITNRESYFFRETAQLRGLCNASLDALKLGGKPGQLRILSAGCAGGEEPYSMAIVLCHALALLRRDELWIDAIDINAECLRDAARALYGPRSLRLLGERELQRYFVPVDEHRHELRPAYRHDVRFSQANLLELRHRSAPGRYDVALCRNVLIYFSDEACARAIDELAYVLRPGGLLFLGHSESIIGTSNAFKPELIGERIAYRRTTSGSP